MDIPVAEFEAVKKYVEEQYGPKCEDHYVGCVGCHVWSVMDELESLMAWDAKGREGRGDLHSIGEVVDTNA